MNEMQKPSLRHAVLELAQERYGTEAEYLWATAPSFAVLRHPNAKWYGVVMGIPQSKLGLDGDAVVDVLNVQCNALLAGSLRQQAGVFPAYHMNKEKWISVLLDGTVEMEEIAVLLDMSYDIASAKVRRTPRKRRPADG